MIIRFILLGVFLLTPNFLIATPAEDLKNYIEKRKLGLGCPKKL